MKKKGIYIQLWLKQHDFDNNMLEIWGTANIDKVQEAANDESKRLFTDEQS